MINCSGCKHPNDSNANFCENCGAKLAVICPSCEHPNKSIANFCNHCGTQLKKEIFPIRPVVKSVAEAERRQITVMFCDLVGSTALSEKLDPEDLRELIQDYQSVCSKVIKRYDGHIAQFLGDGILIYFGFPTAHEDDAIRSIRSGLGILEGMQRLNERYKDIELAVRIGIHTGLVVIGELGGEMHKEQLALGEVPNIAARLQGLAYPNCMVISPQTHQLSEGYFHYKSLGEHKLKGISKPMEAIKVLHESGARNRLEVSGKRGLTPLVGRVQEMEILRRRWQQAKTQQGSLVLISGEAGIGKSRLVLSIKEEIAKEPKAWLTELRCSAHYQNSAFYPIIDLLERVVFNFEKEENAASKIEKLEGFLIQHPWELQQVVPLFAQLLSIPLDTEKYPPTFLSPAARKKKTMEALQLSLLSRANEQPVLLTVEDLHWADHSTLEWLQLFFKGLTQQAIFIICTTRPNFTPRWAKKEFVSAIDLQRLSAEKMQLICQHKSNGMVLPQAVMDQIIAKTDGVPLFVEELTKMVLESDLLVTENGRYQISGNLQSVMIPSTIQDSLMARLDNLSPIKEIVQIGSVIGREFSFELLLALSNKSPEVLEDNLNQLLEAEIFFKKGKEQQAVYSFKHALVQDTAYQTLLKRKKQLLHQRVGTILEKQFPNLASTRPELLAHHYTKGGLTKGAIPLWIKAGQAALEKNANHEAVHHFNTGLSLLPELSSEIERETWELNIQILMGGALLISKGFTHPSVEAANKRAFELCEKLDDKSKLIYAFYGLATYYNTRGQYEKGLALKERALKRIGNQVDSIFEIITHTSSGITNYYLGNYEIARDSLQEGMKVYNPKEHYGLGFLGAGDFKVQCWGYYAVTLCLLGYPDQGLKEIKSTIELAEAQKNFGSIYMAYICACSVHAYRQEWNVCAERALKIINLATEQGETLWVMLGYTFYNNAQAMMGKGKDIEVIGKHLNLTEIRQAGFLMGMPNSLMMAGEIYRLAGKFSHSLAKLAEAEELAEESKEGWGKSEIFRIKALVLQAQNESFKNVAFNYEKSLDITRQQANKWMELRTATDYANYLVQQQKMTTAKDLLAPIFNWFTEGFDTLDFQNAKNCLAAIDQQLATSN